MMKNKIYFVVGLLLMLFVSAYSQTVTQTQQQTKPRLFVIDPGHGGIGIYTSFLAIIILLIF